MEEKAGGDKEIVQKKKIINETLEQVEKKMKSIKENAQSVTAEIKTMLQKALVESAQD